MNDQKIAHWRRKLICSWFAFATLLVSVGETPAHAGLITITETGSITSYSTAFAPPGTPSILNDPFSVTMTFDPSQFSQTPAGTGGCPAQGSCYASGARQGSTTLTIGGNSASAPNNPQSVLSFLQPVSSGFAGLQTISGNVEDVFSSISSVASPIPDPFSVSNLQFSTDVISGSVRISSPLDSGPLAAYTNVLGNVVHLTITGSSPPAPSLFLTVNPAGPNSSSGQPTEIIAALTLANTPPIGPYAINIKLPVTLPSDVTTLQQAATALGYQSFDWVQTITTLPDPSPLSECSNASSCGPPITLTSLDVPVNDPPLNGYAYSTAPAVNQLAFPFVYYLTDTIENPNRCIVYAGAVGGPCIQTLENNGTTLNFFDAPSDLCIAGANGLPSMGYVNFALRYLTLPCGGPTNLAPPNSYLAFMTELVGVKSNFVPGFPCVGTCTDLGGFTWTDNFNGIPSNTLGGTGGVDAIASFSADVAVDSSSGTGGVTILAENGVPLLEPPTLALLVPGMLFLCLTRQRWRSRARTYGMEPRQVLGVLPTARA